MAKHPVGEAAADERPDQGAEDEQAEYHGRRGLPRVVVAPHEHHGEGVEPRQEEVAEGR